MPTLLSTPLYLTIYASKAVEPVAQSLAPVFQGAELAKGKRAMHPMQNVDAGPIASTSDMT